jgi:hypothetical protein
MDGEIEVSDFGERFASGPKIPSIPKGIDFSPGLF